MSLKLITYHLWRDKSTSIHVKNLQHLTTELFKVKNDLSPEIRKEIFVFQENETYNLRSVNHLARKNVWTTQYRIESDSNLGAKLRNLLPREINSCSLIVFKNKIRKWTHEKCLCKLGQTYVKNIGYIWFLRDTWETCICILTWNLNPFGNLA